MYVLMIVNSRKLCCSSLKAILVVKFDQTLALAPGLAVLLYVGFVLCVI